MSRDLRSRRSAVGPWIRLCLVLALLAGLDPSTTRATELAVPAEYVRSLELPGADDHFLRPSGLSVDRRFDEVFVSDPGNNRVTVFGGDGAFIFEIPGRDLFTSPSDVAVDSSGRIYVLGSTPDGGRVFVYDFDGFYLDELVPESETKLELRGLAIDARDRLYLTDASSTSVRVHALDGSFITSIQVLPAESATERAKEVVGSPTIAGSELFVPISSRGTVHVFDLDGRFLRSIGHFGNLVGETNFPVDVAVSPSGLVLVLDKHRFAVVCFDQDGRFLGEFGGKGQREGWYYHPSLLAVDSAEQVYIGQVFQNKVEVCAIPDFIAAKNLETIFMEKESSASRSEAPDTGLQSDGREEARSKH